MFSLNERKKFLLREMVEANRVKLITIFVVVSNLCNGQYGHCNVSSLKCNNTDVAELLCFIFSLFTTVYCVQMSKCAPLH